jgi:hypothetical protein
MSHLINFTDKNIPPCLEYFVLSTFGQFVDKCSVSIRPVMKCFIRHVPYSHKMLDGNLFTNNVSILFYASKVIPHIKI